jgi:ribose transport system permease protein
MNIRHLPRDKKLGFSLGVPATVLLLLVGGALSSPQFLTTHNLLNVLISISIVGIVAVGMAFVTISGGWADLSVPALIATGAIILLHAQPAFGTLWALALAIGACAIAGAVNGMLIGYVKANPIVVTLGTNIIILGIAQSFVGGKIVYNSDPVANEVVLGKIYGVPFIVVVFLGFALAAHFLLNRTVWGRWTVATGGNYAAAAASGVPVRLIRGMSFVFTSIFAGVSGCLLALSLQSVRPVIGIGYDFNSFAALVVGGVSLLGGSGSIPRVIGGLFIIQLMSNIMVLHGFPTTAQGLAEGIVIVFAVAFDIKLRRRSGGLQ